MLSRILWHLPNSIRSLHLNLLRFRMRYMYPRSKSGKRNHPHAEDIKAFSLPYSIWRKITSRLSENSYNPVLKSQPENWKIIAAMSQDAFPVSGIFIFWWRKRSQSPIIVSLYSSLLDLTRTVSSQRNIILLKRSSLISPTSTEVTTANALIHFSCLLIPVD